MDRDEQKKRLKERRADPLSQWKISLIDKVALKHWAEYTSARDDMLRRTHTLYAPWHVVRASDKHTTRLNLIRHVLAHSKYHGKERRLPAYEPAVVFPFHEARLCDGSMAK
jgi:polyphosphate kinase